MFRRTLLHEFHIFYSHAELDLLFFLPMIDLFWLWGAIKLNTMMNNNNNNNKTSKLMMAFLLQEEVICLYGDFFIQ